MTENTYEWFKAQASENKKHIEQNWPTWMQETSGLATTSFPIVGSKFHELQGGGAGSEQSSAKKRGQ